MILLVEKGAKNRELLARFLTKAGYETREADGIDEMQAALDGEVPYKLVLIDVAGLDARLWPLCDRLREQNIPFLILSPRQSRQLEAASLAHGARSVLIKPLAVQQLLALVRTFVEDG